MPANQNPIFPLQGDTPIMTGGAITAANTNLDGSGTLITVFTSQANGSRIDRLRVKPLGTNVASVLRVFVNDGLGNGSAHTTLYGELSLPATTLTQITAILADLDYIMNLVLPIGYKIQVCLGTAAAAGWTVLGIGGDY